MTHRVVLTNVEGKVANVCACYSIYFIHIYVEGGVTDKLKE